MNREEGFTLPELMVVIAIIGILAAVYVGHSFGMRPTNDMHSFGRNLISDIQRARMEAIKRNAFVTVELATTGYQVCVDTDNDVSCSDEPAGNNLGGCNIPQTILFKSTSDAQIPSPTTADRNYADLFDAITFNSKGIAEKRKGGGVIGASGIGYVLANSTDPNTSTWWSRVAVNLTGATYYQTSDNPHVESKWSE